MAIEVIIQDGRECPDDEIPPSSDFTHWINHAATRDLDNTQITVRIVDTGESHQLNASYRGRNQPTNILSFAYRRDELPNQPDSLPVLGDLVICADIVRQEARHRKCTENAHWAHLTIHGMLHLMGYDHTSEQQAREMEALEIQLLEQLDIHNPYER